MEKVNVGVLGATGMVGQNYIRLLAGHPWFQVSWVAASPASAGKKYAEAVAGRWLMEADSLDGSFMGRAPVALPGRAYRPRKSRSLTGRAPKSLHRRT